MTDKPWGYKELEGQLDEKNAETRTVLKTKKGWNLDNTIVDLIRRK